MGKSKRTKAKRKGRESGGKRSKVRELPREVAALEHLEHKDAEVRRGMLIAVGNAVKDPAARDLLLVKGVGAALGGRLFDAKAENRTHAAHALRNMLRDGSSAAAAALMAQNVMAPALSITNQLLRPEEAAAWEEHDVAFMEELLVFLACIVESNERALYMLSISAVGQSLLHYLVQDTKQDVRRHVLQLLSIAVDSNPHLYEKAVDTGALGAVLASVRSQLDTDTPGHEGNRALLHGSGVLLGSAVLSVRIRMGIERESDVTLESPSAEDLLQLGVVPCVNRILSGVSVESLFNEAKELQQEILKAQAASAKREEEAEREQHDEQKGNVMDVEDERKEEVFEGDLKLGETVETNEKELALVSRIGDINVAVELATNLGTASTEIAQELSADVKLTEDADWDMDDEEAMEAAAAESQMIPSVIAPGNEQASATISTWHSMSLSTMEPLVHLLESLGSSLCPDGQRVYPPIFVREVLRLRSRVSLAIAAILAPEAHPQAFLDAEYVKSLTAGRDLLASLLQPGFVEGKMIAELYSVEERRPLDDSTTAELRSPTERSERSWPSVLSGSLLLLQKGIYDSGRIYDDALGIRDEVLDVLMDVFASQDDSHTQSNIVALVGLRGLQSLSHDDTFVADAPFVALVEFLVGACNHAEVMVQSEAIDALMDIFSPDSTDRFHGLAHLLSALDAVSRSYQVKIKRERPRVPEETYLHAKEVYLNLRRFLKYKGSRLKMQPGTDGAQDSSR